MSGQGGIWLVVGWAIWGAGVLGAQERVAGFEEADLLQRLAAYAGPGGGGYYNGSDGAGGFASGGIWFGNSYNADWGSWSGWAVTTTADSETAGWGNQYSVYAGAAREGTAYAVTYAPSQVVLPAGWRGPVGIAVANTTYAALSMRDGDGFAKRFGAEDWYRLTITGLDARGWRLGAVEVYLADFREATGAPGIAGSWIDVDLGGLGAGVANLLFELESTDTGAWGMNTPAYIAVDQLVLAATPAWGDWDLGADGWVDTGAFLGWILPRGDYAYVRALGKWVHLPQDRIAEQTGRWVYIPK